MYNQSEFLDASGNLNHEAVRAHFLRTGKLDGLKKGDVVYVDFDGGWRICVLRRRLPGDVWLAELGRRHPLVNKVVVTVETFGGVAAE